LASTSPGPTGIPHAQEDDVATRHLKTRPEWEDALRSGEKLMSVHSFEEKVNCSENESSKANNSLLPKKGGTGVAALEDDQYNERHHSAIVFSSFRVRQDGMRDF
jgi:hypothetical protein